MCIVHNRQLGVSVGLGETKAYIEKKLGKGQPDDNNFYEYDDGNISIQFESKPDSKNEQACCLVISGERWTTFVGMGVGESKDTIEMMYSNVSDITEPILFNSEGKLIKVPEQAAYQQTFIFSDQTLTDIELGYFSK